ncbi:MAG TPA: redox-sensing transcriptional repressor Rex [Anaerolineae bacterium]|nr:redox-sensing transcriptional repressor Rex [Anaerolineae bacterium]
MVSKAIPDIVVGRLPLYLRALSFLAAEGRQVTSSQELGQKLGISAAQIRKDLSHFGEFGKQGTGYDIKYLSEQLRRILKVTEEHEVALVGAGDLGHALVHYDGFAGKGFRISVVFDNNPQKIGRRLGPFEILDSESIETVIADRGIEVAIVAVPVSAAQEVVDTLVRAGVKAILNYAPITVKVPGGVQVQYIDPVIHLQRMAYYL